MEEQTKKYGWMPFISCAQAKVGDSVRGDRIGIRRVIECSASYVSLDNGKSLSDTDLKNVKYQVKEADVKPWQDLHIHQLSPLSY